MTSMSLNTPLPSTTTSVRGRKAPAAGPAPLSRALSADELAAFGQEIEAIREETLAKVGEKDANYIRRIRAWVRYTEVGGRGLLFAGVLPPAWLAGTILLSLSKILENMELGHNVMHGQYDWMNDPSLQSQDYDWDTACPAAAWRHSHNYMHHTYTNVIDRDRDIGYGLLRLFPEQSWSPRNLLQPLYAAALALFFQWGVAFHDLDYEAVKRGDKSREQFRKELKPVLRKGARKLGKDYLLFPALAGPFFLPVLLGNLCANLARNLWAFMIIFCGHFTENAATFPSDCVEDESRAHWYLRQIRGSSNLEGGPLFHIMSGNLSHQIEHHLFPDVPACRYQEMAPKVREVCERYGQHYNTGSLWKQFSSVVARIFRFSLPARSVQRVTT